LLNNIGLPYKIFVYGSYSEQEYLDYVSKSLFGIWVGSHESQGFAFQEALSCNCPLFVFDVKSMKDECFGDFYPWKNREISNNVLEATSASYWDDSCGIKINDYNNIEVEFNNFINNFNNYKPRNFILNNLIVNIFINNLKNIFQ